MQTHMSMCGKSLSLVKVVFAGRSLSESYMHQHCMCILNLRCFWNLTVSKPSTYGMYVWIFRRCVAALSGSQVTCKSARCCSSCAAFNAAAWWVSSTANVAGSSGLIFLPFALGFGFALAFDLALALADRADLSSRFPCRRRVKGPPAGRNNKTYYDWEYEMNTKTDGTKTDQDRRSTDNNTTHYAWDYCKDRRDKDRQRPTDENRLTTTYALNTDWLTKPVWQRHTWHALWGDTSTTDTTTTATTTNKYKYFY